MADWWNQNQNLRERAGWRVEALRQRILVRYGVYVAEKMTSDGYDSNRSRRRVW